LQTIFGSDAAAKVPSGTRAHEAVDPSGKTNSGRRQDVSQGTMQRPRLSTWRLFLCQNPKNARQTPKRKRDPPAIGNRAPPSVHAIFRVYAPSTPSHTQAHRSNQPDVAAVAAIPATFSAHLPEPGAHPARRGRGQITPRPRHPPAHTGPGAPHLRAAPHKAGRTCRCETAARSCPPPGTTARRYCPAGC